MELINKTRLGLILGTFSALVHIIWLVLIAVAPNALQKFVDLLAAAHLFWPTYIVKHYTVINVGHAATLIVFAFIFGYILAWLFAAVWNLINFRKF